MEKNQSNRYAVSALGQCRWSSNGSKKAPTTNETVIRKWKKKRTAPAVVPAMTIYPQDVFLNHDKTKTTKQPLLNANLKRANIPIQIKDDPPKATSSTFATKEVYD